MRLDWFTNDEFDRGAPRWKEAVWLMFSQLVASGLPGSGWRIALLRRFGAEIGEGVVIKPGVLVKFPWRLHVGDHSWLGERVWFDTLADIRIGKNCCISQGAYLCTGNHDWSRDSFDLMTQDIVLEDRVWVAARTSVGPGLTLREGAVLTMGSVATRDLAAWTIHSGVPARAVAPRDRADLPAVA